MPAAGDSEPRTNVKEDNEDKSEIVEETTIVQNTMPSASQITSEMMQNPQVLAALQQRLDTMVGTTSGYIESLPKVVKRRIHALKNLQVQAGHIEAKFYEEVHEIERKYSALYQPLFEKRCEIVLGSYEPTDDESRWDSDRDDDDEDMKEGGAQNDQEGDIQEKAKLNEDTKGVPSFWLTIFKNVPILQEMVQEHDEPILEKLRDIKLVFSGPQEPMGFTLEFHFEPNQYFTDTVLTKYYKFQTTPDEKDPFSFEGPETTSCKGCTIHWNPGKNVTVKTIKKKQKHKGKGTVRTVTKQVANDSFFLFFNPPDVAEDESEMDSDTEALLASDFEIGHMIRERIIPRAVLYFTGEANDDDFDDEDDEDDDDDEGLYNSDEGSGSENDADYDPEKDPKAQETPQECNQQ